MKIVEVQTVRCEEYAEFIGVQVKTDNGLSGLGETCFGPESVEAYVHESVAPRLLGQDPLTIERHAKELPAFYVTHGGTGVSTLRALGRRYCALGLVRQGLQPAPLPIVGGPGT